MHQAPAAVAAERDVEEVAQEARERHVPAPPEVAEPGRPVGLRKFCGKTKPEQQREADRDVGIAGEVAVDLGGVAVGGQQHVGPAVGLRDGEHRFDERPGQIVGDHDLLDQAERDQREPGADRDAVRVARLASCGRNSRARTIGPATRWGKKLR